MFYHAGDLVKLSDFKCNKVWKADTTPNGHIYWELDEFISIRTIYGTMPYYLIGIHTEYDEESLEFKYGWG